MILDDCPHDCDSSRSLKLKLNNRFPNLDENSETMMKAYNEFMSLIVASCARLNVYCQQPSKKEERLKKYQEAAPNHDLGLGFFKK